MLCLFDLQDHPTREEANPRRQSYNTICCFATHHPLCNIGELGHPGFSALPTSPYLCPKRWARCWAYHCFLAWFRLCRRLRFPSGMAESPFTPSVVESRPTTAGMNPPKRPSQESFTLIFQRLFDLEDRPTWEEARPRRQSYAILAAFFLPMTHHFPPESGETGPKMAGGVLRTAPSST